MNSKLKYCKRTFRERSTVLTLGHIARWFKSGHSGFSVMPWLLGRTLLQVMFLALLVYLGSGFVGLLRDSSEASILLLETAGSVNDSLVVAPQQEPTREIRSSGRLDLFGVTRPQNRAAPKGPKTNPVELLQLLELQGVLGGKNPKAIIVYKKTNDSHTLSVGDDLGEFKVKEIKDRSVILQWREELFELSL